MAASKEAQGLKDAYIEGIMDAAGPEVMAEAGAMDMAKLAGKLGMDVGDQAGVLLDLRAGKGFARADGNPRLVITDGNRRVVLNEPAAAYPANVSGGYGSETKFRIPAQGMKESSVTLHSGPNEMAYITSPLGSDWAEKGHSMNYDSHMKYPFTYGR